MDTKSIDQLDITRTSIAGNTLYLLGSTVKGIGDEAKWTTTNIEFNLLSTDIYNTLTTQVATITDISELKSNMTDITLNLSSKWNNTTSCFESISNKISTSLFNFPDKTPITGYVINLINTNNSSIQVSVNNINNDVNQLSVAIYGALHYNNNSIYSKINNLSENIDNANESIDTLNNILNNISDVNVLSNNIDYLSNKISTNLDYIKEISDDITIIDDFLEYDKKSVYRYVSSQVPLSDDITISNVIKYYSIGTEYVKQSDISNIITTDKSTRIAISDFILTLLNTNKTIQTAIKNIINS